MRTRIRSQVPTTPSPRSPALGVPVSGFRFQVLAVWIPTVLLGFCGLSLLVTTMFSSCSGEQLTVKDAQLGLEIACEALATVLQAQHPHSTPDALRLALEACNVERTTKIMNVLLTEHSRVVDVQSIELAPSPFLPADAGPSPRAPTLP